MTSADVSVPRRFGKRVYDRAGVSAWRRAQRLIPRSSISACSQDGAISIGCLQRAVALMYWPCSLLLVLLRADAIAGRGYHVDFQSFGELIGVKKRLQGIQGFKEGFTVGLWLKYRDLSSDRRHMEVSIVHQQDDNFLNGLGGGAGETPWLFSSGHPHPFSKNMAPEDFLQWHHYAFAFNAIDGSAKIYLDGAKVTEFPKKGYAYATTWADLNPSITLGTMCYHAADGVSRECFLKNRMFNGLMDDFSLWNFSLSDAEIAQTWNASMAERIADGLEPRCARPPLLAPSLPQPCALPAPASRPPRSSARRRCACPRGAAAGSLSSTTSTTRSPRRGRSPTWARPAQTTTRWPARPTTRWPRPSP